MPLQTRLCSSFHHVRKVVEEEFGYLASIFDDDGICRITRRGSEVLGELIEDRGIPVFRVFCSLLDECESTEELLQELNELNENTAFVRLFLKDGVVTAESDLVAERMDCHELRTATERILNVAQEVIPTLALVLGGRQFDDPFQKRLAKYRQTWVEAEVFPGVCQRLNGTGGIAEWPFPGPIHVLTSWNPEGVEISDEVAADINRKIAAEVLAYGGRFVLASGHTPQSPSPEPSLVVWNLDRDVALTISGKASRDAVLEITSDHVLLISENGNVVEQWDRR